MRGAHALAVAVAVDGSPAVARRAGGAEPDAASSGALGTTVPRALEGAEAAPAAEAHLAVSHCNAEGQAADDDLVCGDVSRGAEPSASAAVVVGGVCLLHFYGEGGPAVAAAPAAFIAAAALAGALLGWLGGAAARRHRSMTI